MDEHGENFNKELENIKKDQLGLKNTINKMKKYTRGNQQYYIQWNIIFKLLKLYIYIQWNITQP